MKLKRLISGALAAVMSVSLLVGPGGFALPAKAAEADGPALDDSVILFVDFEDNVDDKSPSGYNGTITGSGVTYVDSPFGSKAVKIVNQDAKVGSANDNATADSYVDFGTEISETGLGDKDFTLSFWYKPDPEMNSWGAIISNKDYGKGSNQGFALGYYSGNDCKMNLVPSGGKGKNTQVSKINLNQDGGWHHFTVSVVPGGTMTAYVDGQSAGSVSIPGGTVHAGFPLILGAGGNLKNPITGVCVDELRIDNRALSAGEVEALYEENAAAADAAGASATLLKLRENVAAVETGVICTQADQEALLAEIDAVLAELEAGSLDAETIISRLAELEDAYQAFLNGQTPLASFHMISDVHVDSASQTATNAANYIKAMENMKKLNPDTTIAFVNAGDNTQSGQSAQYEGFYTATKEHNPVTGEQTLILLGNHDVRGANSGGNWNADPSDPTKFPYWATAKNLYLTNNADYMPTGWDGQTLYHSKTLGGYTFLMLNTELGLKDAMYMSDEQLAWFEAEMKAAYEADPSKPVFIICHQALNDTHWRSNTLNGFDGVQTDGTGYPYQTGKDAAVKEIMEKYPNGIFLSGHIHNGFGVASVIPRSYGVNVDVPSFNESENGVTDKGVGYEVMIYDGYVAFRARNFITEQWLPEYDVVVPVGEQSYPRLIQALEPAMSDLQWYSEADAARLQDAFGSLWSMADRYYDQAGIAYNAPAPAVDQRIFTPDQLKELAALAEEAWAEIGLLDEVTRLEAPRKTVYEEMRESWRDYLLGGSGDDLDLTVPAIASYVKGLNTSANRYWNSMVKGGVYNGAVFPDLNMTEAVSNATTRSGNMGTTLNRLATLSMAWGTRGCDLYHSDIVLKEIISATDYVVNNFFQKGKYSNRGAYGNWYHWEITCPTALGNIAMVLYDELGAERVQLYGQTIQYYAPGCDVRGPNSPGPEMTGGNLLLKANGVAQAGILLEDDAMLENVRAGVKRTVSGYNDPDSLFSTGNAGDGFYADGSYIQHQALPYIAGYGADLYNNFSVFSRLFKGTPWEIRYEADEEPLIYDFVFTGIEPFICGTRTMDMVASRDITRSSRNDRARTASILSALLCMRGTFPTDEQNQRFDEMMKFYIGQDPDYYYARMGSIVSIQNANDLMQDSSISPRSNYYLTKTFAMDRTVHYTDGFALGIAMQSSRTFAHEIINSEGKRTWNIANGMVFLYDGDEDQYGGGYWCTVDPTRLPGITAEHVVLADGRGSLNANIYDWTGGSSIGSNGVAGMHMRALSRSDNPSSYAVGPRTGADMKKSWFMFGDRVLMMGSSITSGTGDHVETTVENRKIRLDGSNTVTVDGAAANLSTDSAAPTVLENPSWLHLEGNVTGADIGYYFPENITLQAMKDTRTGDWSAQGTTSGTATNTYATFYVDHGVKPVDAGYAYVLLPGRTAAETAAYAAQPDIEILQNDGAVHAARDNSRGILAANFWQAGTVDVIAVSAPASVIMERTGNTVTIGVSDPTQRDVPITVTLAMVGEIVSKDDTVTVDQTTPFLRFTVDTTEGLGGTHTVTFQVDEAADVELIEAVSTFEPVVAAPGASFHTLDLPETAVFLANDGSRYELELTWSRGDYAADAYGKFTLTALPVLPEGIFNSANIQAELTVETAGYQVTATGDTYVNDGNKADVNYGSSGSLAVKLDGTSYQRRALFQFDLTGVPAHADRYLFNVSASMDDLFQGGAVYLVGNDWDPAAVTWNTAPAKVSEQTVATFGKIDLKDGILSLDITEAVRQAQENGDTTLSLMVTATGSQHSKNQMSISSLESNAAQKPAIISEKGGGPARDKENLRFLLALARSLDGARFLNYDGQAMDVAVADAQAVLDDASATRGQVNDAEDALMRLLLGLRVVPNQ